MLATTTLVSANDTFHGGAASSTYASALSPSRAFTSTNPEGGGIDTNPLATAAAAAKLKATRAAFPITVKLSDARKENDGTVHAHVTFLITMQRTDPETGSVTKTALRRRFQDFAWLHSKLSAEFPVGIIPPMPGKHRMEYLTGDRFSPEFIERRRQGLERFIARVVLHPLLRRSKHTVVFLENRDWSSEFEAHGNTAGNRHGQPNDNNVLDALSDKLMNVFTKLKQQDPRFIEMNENAAKLEETLLAIDKICTRIFKRQSELSNLYDDFSLSICDLGRLETGMTYILHQTANTLRDQSNSARELTAHCEEEGLSQLHEYVSYTRAFRHALRNRDQKQLDIEEIESYKDSNIAERDRLVTGGRTGGSGIGGFFKDRMNDLRGANTDELKQEKVVKLNERIQQLEEAVKLGRAQVDAASEELINEEDIFRSIKAIDFKRSMTDIAQQQMEFYEKYAAAWESLIPTLERLRIE
ncbi:hypothetical protein GQ42DRAFT_122930 [Ramicandelaber brevisporus]|nr:hypothetical protein GQ42DRAFT_122930 [Ramicandelaber brevisporus]